MDINMNTRAAIKELRDRITIGETITVKKGETSKRGIVIGKYEHYCLIQRGPVKEAVLWVDLIGK